MPLGKHQRHAVLNRQPAKVVPYRGAPLLQRNVLAGVVPFFVEFVCQQVIDPTLQHPPKDVDLSGAGRIVRVPTERGRQGVEHYGRTPRRAISW